MAENGGGAYAFVMSFVAASDKYRSQFVDKWQEVVSNFIVDGSQVHNMGGQSTPYSRERVIYKNPSRRVYLRDPETHKLVMTYAAKLARAILGDREGKFVQAQPVGYEDVPKAVVTTKLLRYFFLLPGHFRTLVEAMVDMILFGTSVVEVYWRYEEKEVIVRTVESDGMTEVSTTTRQIVPTYDDPCLRVVDVMDFYPDPGRYRIEDMAGCAKKFKMNGYEAKQKAEQGYYSKSAVRDAMGGGGASDVASHEDSFRAGYDQPAQREPVPDFNEKTGYEYHGDIPADADVKDDITGEKITRGVITIWNQKVIRARAWPLLSADLPFGAFVINPVQGRFYGISPAETVRFNQAFADSMMQLLAEAMIRRVHPPIAYDSDADFDVAKLREWKADLPIPVRGGPSAIGTLQYDADVNGGFNLLMGLKEEIKGGSGALGGIQGEEGPDRESATGAQQRVQMALDRPELAGMILESECLPRIGKQLLKLGQQFIEDTEDLKRRVGEIPDPFWIGDILGDYDVRFVGSRNAMSNQEKLQAVDRLISMGTAFPAFQAFMPNIEVGQMIVGELMGLPEAAGQIGDPQTFMQNIQLTQAMGMAGAPAGPAGNGVPQAAQPPGMLPAQAAGGTA